LCGNVADHLSGNESKPMAYTLATAAEAAKVTKPTVFRWIKTGKISAVKAENGTYRIEPAELHRYLDSVAKETLPDETAKQAETPLGAAADTLPEMIALRSEVEKLKALLEMERQRAEDARQRVEDVKAERDRWAQQAERLALPRPETTRNGFFGWLKRA
jgi:excisionase family DNA binding protein